MIEELVLQRFELPGFSTLQRTARQARSTVNTGYFRTLNADLTAQQKQEFDRLLRVPDDSHQTSWHKLKQETKKPTNTEVNDPSQRLTADRCPGSTCDTLPKSVWNRPLRK